jgi:hypothetical protein
MDINVKCPCCRKESNLHLTLEQTGRYELFKLGVGHIQDLLPDLTNTERELLLTGICTECWQKMEEDDE